MKNAFTLLELVVVIVILGVLAAVGSNFYKVDHLNNDALFISSKIKQTQYEAMMVKNSGVPTAATQGCIELSKAALEDTTSGGKTAYRLHATLGGTLANSVLCFDEKGRPLNGSGFGISSLFHNIEVLNLSYAGKNKEIELQPLTGYVIINHF